jgi:hypothetical protein
MKKQLLKPLLIIGLILFGHQQTTAQLAVGDIAIIGVNEDAGPIGIEDHSFTWISLTDIPAGEVIYFTEQGVNVNSMTWFSNTEGHFSWTAPAGGLPCGSVVHIYENGASSETLIALGGGTMSAILSGSGWNLGSGDQVLVYQANAARSAIGSTTFITGIHLNDDLADGESNGWTSLAYNATGVAQCHLPPGLTDAVNCISLYSLSSPENDNNRYTGTLTGTSTALRALINSPFPSGNWSGNNSGPTDISVGTYFPSVTCIAACVNPDLPTSLIANSSIICSGSNSILSWIGNLNDATQWAIYTNSCGGTLVGTSATNSFTTGALTSTTIFYIRGEDGAGCVDESTGLCAFVTVSVNALPTTPSAINPLTVCPSEDVILTATGSGTGDIVFYDNTEVEIQRNTMGGTATQTFNTGALTNGNYTFYVAEDNGTCQSLYDTLNVFVGDTVSPTLVCQPATVYLDNSGLAIVFPSDIDGGSSDNCGSVNLTTSIQTFTCNELGANNVTLFGNDGYGNTSSCLAVVTVMDTIIPIVACQNITIFLDASGLAIISANDIDNGSSDNCGGITLNSSIQTFTCNEIGTNQVMLYASDASNNIDSCMALVIVLDTISPVINCLGDQTDLATASCQFTVPDYTAAATVFATDNCSALPIITQTPITGSLVGLGASTITLTADDGNGNTSSCNFTLTVSSSASGTLGTTICNGDSFMFNGTLYNGSNTSGVETITGAAANGCDSIVTVTVIVVPSPDVTVTNASPTLTANQTGATYQWLDCDNGNAIIPTATNQAFTPSTDGNYAVEITLGGCVDTSACENVSTVGVNETNLSKGFNIYPNPTKGLFTVSLDKLDNNTTIIVYSIVGKEVINQKITNNKTIINLEGFDKGIYFVKIQNGNQLITERIVKQ